MTVTRSQCEKPIYVDERQERQGRQKRQYATASPRCRFCRVCPPLRAGVALGGSKR